VILGFYCDVFFTGPHRMWGPVWVETPGGPMNMVLDGGHDHPVGSGVREDVAHCAVQKQLNGSRSCLGRRLVGTQGTLF